MATFQLSAPWTIFYRQIQAMFKNDDQVHVIYDEATPEIKVYVEDGEKADAIAQILLPEKTFGNVTVKVAVVPANGVAALRRPTKMDIDELFITAFEGNPALSFTRVLPCVFSNNMYYIVFQNRVVQFYTDDLGDYYGQCSTLYQEIAKEIFVEREGVFYCTDKPVSYKASTDDMVLPF